MSRRPPGRHAVLLCDVGDDWRPTHWHTLPVVVYAAHWHKKKLHIDQALKIIKQHNLAAMPCNTVGQFAGQWMILVTNARSTERWCRRNNRRVEISRRYKLISHAVAKATAEGNHDVVRSLRNGGAS